MHTIFQKFSLLEPKAQILSPFFFAGANTGAGFAGEYDRIADERKNSRVWILKGGSGTGKSTLIRKIADAAEETGHRCVRYLCSSDPDSLDAAVVDGKFVILDGTAPHVREMEYPGAVSEIVYVGKYWKRELLEERREEIIRLTKAKKDAYTAGYKVLSALSGLEAETYRTAETLLDPDKMRRWIGRLLKGVPKGERTGETETCRSWAVSMSGAVRTDGLAQAAEYHWLVEDTCETAPCFFSLLARMCREERVPVCLSLHPVNDRVVEVFIPPLSLHLSLAAGKSAPDKTICMNRFLQKELPAGRKGEIHLSARCMTELLDMACGHFREAGEHHSALEEIYKGTMDFSQLNRESTLLKKQILKYIEEN